MFQQKYINKSMKLFNHIKCFTIAFPTFLMHHSRISHSTKNNYKTSVWNIHNRQLKRISANGYLRNIVFKPTNSRHTESAEKKLFIIQNQIFFKNAFFLFCLGKKNVEKIRTKSTRKERKILVETDPYI